MNRKSINCWLLVKSVFAWLTAKPKEPFIQTIFDKVHAKKWDQYYTDRTVARWCYWLVLWHFPFNTFHIVEPSAGDGAFVDVMPPDTEAYDTDPQRPYIIQKDFLSVKLSSANKIAVIGNPPFGVQGALAVAFFNHAASMADVIGMILPASFQRDSMQNKLNEYFHLVSQTVLPDKSFLFCGKKHHVPAVFQIWKRRNVKRVKAPAGRTHPDFKIVNKASAALAHFVMQRIGAGVGTVKDDLTSCSSSHFFIHDTGKQPANYVKTIMSAKAFRDLGLQGAVCPVLNQSQIVWLYRQHTEPLLIFIFLLPWILRVALIGAQLLLAIFHL
jgi:predicted RNA methylase